MQRVVQADRWRKREIPPMTSGQSDPNAPTFEQAALADNAQIYPGLPYGQYTTRANQINRDRLGFSQNINAECVVCNSNSRKIGERENVCQVQRN